HMFSVEDTPDGVVFLDGQDNDLADLAELLDGADEIGLMLYHPQDRIGSSSEVVNTSVPVVSEFGPLMPTAGMNKAQWDWGSRHGFWVGGVWAGADGLFEAVVEAHRGGFTIPGGAYVSDAAQLRELLAAEAGDALAVIDAGIGSGDWSGLAGPLAPWMTRL